MHIGVVGMYYDLHFVSDLFTLQVCFRTLWRCHPLNEKEFEHAISENYFSAKKFKFGLTEVQV